MQCTIIKKEENPLLKRTAYTIKIDFEGATPKRADVIKEIANILNCDESLIIVRKIRGIFGTRSCLILSSVYNDKESLDKIESKYIKKRHGLIENKEEKDDKDSVKKE